MGLVGWHTYGGGTASFGFVVGKLEHVVEPSLALARAVVFDHHSLCYTVTWGISRDATQEL